MTPGVPHAARVRAYLAGLVVTAGLCGVAYRAWALQVDEGDHYRELAARQHASNVNIPAPRGDVVDARGRPLAISADADSVWANPREIKDVTDTADKLARILGMDASVLEDKLAADKKFVWLDRHVTRDVADQVRAAELPGVVVTKEPRRWYPARTIAGPVIGRADIDSRGLEGIELSMNEVLQGHRGSGTAVRDAHGRKMFADGMEQPEPGATVHMSLDRSIQAITDEALAEAVTTNKAKSGVAVVLDVKTSKVLAMSSYPTYDPNSSEPHAGARNKPVTDAFEAGSVMKVFTIAAALDAGLIKPDTGWDTSVVQVGPKAFRDVHFSPYLTTTGVIKRSSNVGTIRIAHRLGKEKLYAALKLFGFGAKSGIELPGEQPGRVRDGSKWRDIEAATISFGYGITVTPLQIAAALAAIGNDGVYTEPRIVDSIVDPDGTLLYEAKPASRRMVSAKTAKQMREMLATVFEGGKEGGTGGAIIVPGFRCGGKTGTAHKYDHEIRKYSPNRYLGSFIGLAPIENPRLAIVVMIDEPSGRDYFGGLVAGPVFAKVASESLRYLGVPGLTLQCPTPPPGWNPYLDPTPKTCTIPAPKLSLKMAKKPIPPPVEQAPATEDADAAPPPPPDAFMIPDFRGLGTARALELARVAKLPVEVVGTGQVVEQDPLPGPVEAPGKITLRFSDGKTLSRPAP
ncbi:MAG: penicillin-binding transpeptidase domain-containing protein [Kofleriaceae bacterium]|nr:penicillin-binding transpeptidase domain-containing protein [Kofleriaceae bacterium]